MRTIRFARHHHPEDETEGAEMSLGLDCRLPVADDAALLSASPVEGSMVRPF